MLIFERDPATGLLTLRDTVSGAGATPFDSPRAMAVSPNGAHLYLETLQDGIYTIAVFARDPVDGSLEWTWTFDDGEPTDMSSYGNRGLAVAPDGRHFYAVRHGRSDLVVFERDPATGALTRLETITDDELGTGGLDRAVSVAVSADSQLIFVAGRNMITTFSRRCLTTTGLCLSQERFRAEVAWRSFDGTAGAGNAVPVATDDSGLLWFFEAANWEMLIKVLDGCALNDRFWVFAGATTTVEYTLRVTDTATGVAREYFNPLGERAAAITDTDSSSKVSSRSSTRRS